MRDNSWQQELQNPSFTQRIYSQYDTQPNNNLGMGGIGNENMGGASSGSSGTWNEEMQDQQK